MVVYMCPLAVFYVWLQDAVLLAYQIGFDLYESATQDFLQRVLAALRETPQLPATAAEKPATDERCASFLAVKCLTVDSGCLFALFITDDFLAVLYMLFLVSASDCHMWTAQGFNVKGLNLENGKEGHCRLSFVMRITHAFDHSHWFAILPLTLCELLFTL